MAYESDNFVVTDFLVVQVTGKRTYEAVVEMTHQLFEAMKEHQKEKILIDVRGLEGRLRIMDSYRVVTGEFPKLRGKGIAKAAIVDRPRSGRMYWFLETVARNRGFNLRIFEAIEQAKAWLRVDSQGV